MANVSDRGLRSALAPLRRRLSALAARAVVRLVDDSKARQLLQIEILKGELRDAVERMQDYGFASHPHPGADAAVLCLTGDRDHAVAIVVGDRRYRMQLEPGEVAVFDDLGNSVQLLRDRIKVTAVTLLEVVAPSVTVTSDDATVTAGTVTIEADIIVNGNTVFNGTVEANGKRIDDTHRHVNSGGSGLGGVPQ